MGHRRGAGHRRDDRLAPAVGNIPLNASAVVFVQAAIDNELIPDKVRNIAAGRELSEEEIDAYKHTPAYFDHDLYRGIFTTAYIWKDAKGIHLSSIGAELVRHKYVTEVRDLALEAETTMWF